MSGIEWAIIATAGLWFLVVVLYVVAMCATDLGAYYEKE